MTNKQRRRAMKHIDKLSKVIKCHMRVHAKYSESKDFDKSDFYYVWRWGINRMKENFH